MREVKEGIGRAVERALPYGSRRRAFVSRAVQPAYAADVRTFRRYISGKEMASVSEPVSYKGGPRFSVVVPAFNTPDRYLEPMVGSVLAQTYAGWELILVNGCTNPERSKALERQAGKDPRIRVITLSENLGIAGNTNAGLRVAEGDFIAFLDHDDCLSPFALNEVAVAVEADPSRDLFYSDEDLLSENGRARLGPLLKPAWSPEMFLGANFLAHFSVASSRLVETVGGIRSEYDGAQDWDFLLRAAGWARGIHHVPHISYHWRQAAGSAATGSTAKPYAESARYRAVRDHLQRLGIRASVVPIPSWPGNFRVAYAVPEPCTVHAVGAGLAGASGVAPWAEGGMSVRLMPDNWSLAGLPDEDLLLFVETPGGAPDGAWLRELVGVALQPDVGVAGAALCGRDGSCRGVCYVADQGRLRALVLGEPLDRWTKMTLMHWPRNLISLGGVGVLQVAVCRRLMASGSSLDLASLSLAAYRSGLRNVLWPFAAFTSSGPLPRTDVVPPGTDPYLSPVAVALAASVDA